MSTKHRYPRWGPGNVSFYLYILAGLAGTGIAVLCSAEGSLVPLAVGIATFMVGGIFGFIFGIPVYAASASERAAQEMLRPGSVQYRANTNLEQISDWLTKIIVGLSLVQARSIADLFLGVSRDVGEAIGGEQTTQHAVEAGALILFTFLTGFLFFYLWSRVYLPRLFQIGEQAGNDVPGAQAAVERAEQFVPPWSQVPQSYDVTVSPETPRPPNVPLPPPKAP